MARASLSLTACLLVAGPASAQPSPSAGDRKQATAIFVSEGRIRVDGRLDEDAWIEGPPIDDFV